MKEKKKRSAPERAPSETVVHIWQSLHEDKTDPNGSYTGRPKSENETPVQDADDL